MDLIAKIAWHYLCQEGRKNAFSCTLSGLAKNFWAQNSANQEQNYKNSGFSGNCQNKKWHLFFEKGVLWHGWKSVFTVFLESCVFLKTLFCSVFSKHSFLSKKMYVEKNKNLWKIVSCFEQGKKVLFGLLFSGFNVFVVGFLCVW